MDNDDQLSGRLLSRRELFALMTAAGAALVAACADDEDESAGPPATRQAAGASPTVGRAPSCVVQPELIEGPYFVDRQLERRDIRADSTTGEAREGVALALSLIVAEVSRDGSCQPLAGALIDVWQCDAFGVYSGVEDPAFHTLDQDWLRGYQVTDAGGRAEFITIYPGWYPGRATHIHFKIRTDPQSAVGTQFTSQLFFDDWLSDEVHSQGVYAPRGAVDRVRNEDDAFFPEGGDQLVLDVQPAGDGYAATFAIGVML